MSPVIQIAWPPRGMTITRSSGITGSVTSHVIPLPVDATNGDLVIILWRVPGTVTVTPPPGWISLLTRSDGGNTLALYRVLDGSEGATVTVVTAAARRSAHTLHRIKGAAVNEAAFIIGNIQGGLDPANITPPWGASNPTAYIVHANLRRTDNTLTAPGGYDDTIAAETGANAADAAHCRVASAHKINSSASENPAAWAQTGTLSNPHCAVIAVRQAP